MLKENVLIGVSPSGVEWVAYAGRHNKSDVARMRQRLAALWARSKVRADLASSGRVRKSI